MSSDISMFLANCCLCFDTSRGCKKFCAILNREVFSFETDGGRESEENQLQLIESNHATLHTDTSSMHNMDIVFTVLIALVLRVWVQILSCPCIFFCSVNSLQFRLARNTAIKMVFVFLANSPNGVDVTVV